MLQPIKNILKLSAFAVAALGADSTALARADLNAVPTGTIKPFKDGDVIAYLGDSITCGGRYHKYIYNYWVTRYPETKIRYVNKGIFSDFATGGIFRLKSDVLLENPNKLFINYGMNDSGASWRKDLYGMEDPNQEVLDKRLKLYDDYKQNMSKLITMLTDEGKEVGLIGPSIYDETAKLKYANHLGANGGIQACIDRIKDIAKERSLEFVDFNEPMLAVNKWMQAKDPSSTIVGSDRIHPEKIGHYLMASVFLKAQGVSPIVAEVVVDAKEKTLKKGVRATVKDVQSTSDSLSFTYCPKALPIAVNDEYTKAESVVDLTQEFNRELITVKDLAEGYYKLTMDGKVLGSYSSEEFAKGVNIAAIVDSPQQKHSLNVSDLIDQRAKIEAKIRGLRQCDARQAKLFLEGKRDEVYTFFEAELEKAKSGTNKHMVKRYEVYLKDFKKESLYAKQILELEEKIYSSNKPGQYAVVITRTNKLEVASIFKDNMVLQRGQSVPVWGECNPGAKITVSFAGQTKTVTGDSNGKWMAHLPSMEASSQGRELVVTSPGKKISFKNVLVGEVWIGSGQSNMEEKMKYLPHKSEVASYKDPLLRIFTTERVRSFEKEAKSLKGEWLPVDPANTPEFSGIAYFFAKRLRAQLDVPVGVIVSSWGGTPIQFWTDTQSYATAKKKANSSTFTNSSRYNCNLFNGMIAPLIPFAVKGVIWYQGESNTANIGQADDYSYLYRELIQGWRKRWGNDSLPFIGVQLPNYSPIRPREWPLVREGFLKVSRELSDAGMVVTLDLGEPKNIHPRNKSVVGPRLAEWALTNVYKKDGHSYHYPDLDRIQIKGSTIEVTMKDVDDGLVCGKYDVKKGFSVVDEELQAFYIAGSDKKFYPAMAKITSTDTIVVSNPKVTNPVAVRYAWANDPIGCNLFTKQGYAATPFKSDNWDKPHAYDLLKAGPQFEPMDTVMDKPQQLVTMSVPEATTTIYYTLDGSVPNANSAVYTKPITVNDKTWVRAVGIDDLGRTSLQTKSFYHVPPPKPPLPVVRLEELQYTHGKTGRGKITKNVHYHGRPMTVKGARYDHGISVHSPSELRYTIDPSYKKFVATAGVNDGNHDLGTVSFVVSVDGKKVAESPVIGMGTIWHFNVDLPAGAKELKLVTTDGGDNNSCDDANWINGGFIK